MKRISELKQNESIVTSYFGQLKNLWDQLGHLGTRDTCPTREKCGRLKAIRAIEEQDRIVQFLMGLNDQFNVIRSQILTTTLLPSLIHTILRDEKQKGVYCGSGNERKNPITYNVSKGKDQKKDRSNLFCTNCKKNGHLKDKCYWIIRFPL
jgi:hypothetical protein